MGITHGRPLEPEKNPEERMDDDEVDEFDPNIRLTEYDLELPMSKVALNIREAKDNAENAEDMDTK